MNGFKATAEQYNGDELLQVLAQFKPRPHVYTAILQLVTNQIIFLFRRNRVRAVISMLRMDELLKKCKSAHYDSSHNCKINMTTVDLEKFSCYLASREIRVLFVLVVHNMPGCTRFHKRSLASRT